jgi:hypothetical protein
MQTTKDVVERQSCPDYHPSTRIKLDTQNACGDLLRVPTQRRAPSDEQEKQPLQNETVRKRNKFSGVKKMPAVNNAKPRSPLAL